MDKGNCGDQKLKFLYLDPWSPEDSTHVHWNPIRPVAMGGQVGALPRLKIFLPPLQK